MKQRRRTITPRIGSRPLGDDSPTPQDVERVNGYLQVIRWVEELPKATAFLNYRGEGPPVGSHHGPNMMGEFFTVVGKDPGQGPRGQTRVGLAYGVYKVKEPASA